MSQHNKYFKLLAILVASVGLFASPAVSLITSTPVYASTSVHVSSHVSTTHVTTTPHTSTTGTHALTSTHTSIGSRSTTMNPASRFGGTTSRSGGFTSSRSNPASRFTNSTTRSTTSTSSANRFNTNRTYTKSFMNNTRERTAVYNSTANRNLGINRVTLGANARYTDYFANPYANRYYIQNHYNNLWFYAWMWNKTLTAKQHNILVTQGIDHGQLLKNSANTYKITVNTKTGKRVVIVSKAQYDKINVGDKIHLFNGKLTVNGKLI